MPTRSAARGGVVLVGLPGTGKTTIGRAIATLLGLEFVDTDELVEQRVGMGIDELWQRVGESAFRTIEADVVRTVSQRLASGDGLVVAAAGGAILRPGNRWHLYRNNRVVWLDASVETIVERLRAATYKRPHLDYRVLADELRRLSEERARYYRPATRVDAGAGLDEVVTRILACLREAKPPASLYDSIRGLGRLMIASDARAGDMDEPEPASLTHELGRGRRMRRGGKVASGDLVGMMEGLMHRNRTGPVNTHVIVVDGSPCFEANALPDTLVLAARIALVTGDEPLRWAIADLLHHQLIHTDGHSSPKIDQVALAECWLGAVANASSRQIRLIAEPWVLQASRTGFLRSQDAVTADTIAAALIAAGIGVEMPFGLLMSYAIARMAPTRRSHLLTDVPEDIASASIRPVIVPGNWPGERFRTVPNKIASGILSAIPAPQLGSRD